MTYASGKRAKAGRRRMAGSLNRLKRKGCTASSRSGPPRFISTTAVRAMSGVRGFSHQTSERLHILRRCFGQHTVAEIEDVRPLAERPAESPHGLFESRPSGDQHDRIEVSLHRPVRLQVLLRIARRHRRIDADSIDPRLAKIMFVQNAGAARKTDDRTI